MDIPRIYESVIILNNRLEGLLARLDLLSGVILDSAPGSDLYFLASIPERQCKNVLKDQKMFAEFFPLESREAIKTALKPHMDSLLEVADMPSSLTPLLAKMVEHRVHLDLSINPSLAVPVLKTLSNLTSLLFLLFSSPMSRALLIPELYSKLSDHHDEELKGLKTFLKDCSRPIEALNLILQPYSGLLATAVLSAGKILERGEEQAEYHLQNLLISQEGLQTPDEIHNKNSGVRDTIQPFELAKWTFLTLIVSGTQWDLKNKDDPCTRVLRTILTTGWLTNLFREHMLNLHTTLTESLKKSKDKNRGKKMTLVKSWEDEAQKNAPNLRKKKRQMLALLLEDYSLLFEDQVCLVGPRILLILTLMAHATSEINWLVVHQNGPSKRKDVDPMLKTGQETIAIIYHLVRLRELISANQDILKLYAVDALQLEDLKQLPEMMDQLEIPREVGDLVDKVRDGIQAIQVTEEGKVESAVHRYDVGRVITALSCQSATTSSPCQVNPKMASQLEMVFLHTQLLQDPTKLARRVSDLNFLYFYRDTFEDYFLYLMTAPQSHNLSYTAAFPSICQDFPLSLNRTCPEEYDTLISDSHQLTNSFLDQMAVKAVELVESYCSQYISLARETVPAAAAKEFSAKEQQFMESKGKTESELLEAKEKKKKRKETLIADKTNRKHLFTLDIEKVTIGLSEILKAFFTKKCITVASYNFYPEAFFLEKLRDKIEERLKGFIHWPGFPSQILLKMSSYHTALTHIDPGMDTALLFRDVLYNLRADDEITTHAYLAKYREKLMRSLDSPHCYYSSSMACFLALTPRMEHQPDPVEVLTSVEEVSALSEIFGVEGLTWLTAEIGTDITATISRLLHIVKDNSEVLADEDENSWKSLINLPDFITSAIQLGKKVALIQLLDEGHSNVTKQRVDYLKAVVDLMYNSEMSQLLGVPDSIQAVASAMGNHQARVERTLTQGEGGQQNSSCSQSLVTMMGVLLPCLARLETTRYFPSSLVSSLEDERRKVPLDVHQNSLECLARAVNFIISGQEGELDSQQFCKHTLELPLDTQKNNLGALVLAYSLQVVGVQEGLPFSLLRAARNDASGDKRLAQEDVLAKELTPRKLAKLYKK